MSLRIIATGGTFDKHYDPLAGNLIFRDSVLPEALDRARLSLPVKFEPLLALDSLDMQDSHRQQIREACERSAEDRIVIVHGTDTMPETAKVLGQAALKKIPNNHEIYQSFFKFEKGPPTTSFELNGWGDDLVHDYLKAIEINGRIGVLYSNKDYGCEWDYDFRNKRFYAEDNTKFGVNIIMYAMGV